MSGFEKPNYTQTPNAFYDRVLKEIDSMSELKVTLAVIRHTMGFHRAEHELSLSYLVEYTGLRRETVIDGLKRAMKRGTVGRRESGNTFAYFMKVVGKPDQQGSRKTGPVASRKTGPKKERSKESSEPKGSASNAARFPDIEKDTFGHYVALANAQEVIVAPEDRNQTARHFKDLKRLQQPNRVELNKVVAKMLEARTSGYDMSPQKALDKVRHNNVTPLRPAEPERDPETLEPGETCMWRGQSYRRDESGRLYAGNKRVV